jgi:thioredoxin-related protein
MTNKTLLMVVAVVSILSSALLAAGDGKKGPDWDHHTGKVPFVIGYDNGMAEVKFSGKPAMLFFTTTWCTWCKKLAGESFVDDSVVKDLLPFVPVLVDGDKEGKWVAKYKIQGYPNIRFLNARGEVVESVSGYVATDEFRKTIASAVQKVGEVKYTSDYQKIAEASAKLAGALQQKQYADALTAIGDIEKANHQGPDLTRARKARSEIEGLATKGFAEAEALVKSDPQKAAELFGKVESDFKGLEIAKKAGAQSRKLAAKNS